MQEPPDSDHPRTRWCTSKCCPNTPCLRLQLAAASRIYGWTQFRQYMARQQKRLIKLGTVDPILARSLHEFTDAIVADIGFPMSLKQRIVIVGEAETAEDLLHARIGALAWWPSVDGRS